METKAAIPPYSHIFVEMYKKRTNMASVGVTPSIIFLSDVILTCIVVNMWK